MSAVRPLTAEMAEAAKEYVRAHAESAVRQRLKAVRVDPRQLAITSDYIARLETMLGELEREQEVETGKIRNRLSRYVLVNTQLRALLTRGLVVLVKRPGLRVWRWRAWQRAFRAWLTDVDRAVDQTQPPPGEVG